MAGGKEIRTKIESVQNTQKITSAMEMVAASKMRKAKDRMTAARPYAEKMRSVVGHLANAHPEYKHPFLIERDVKRVGYIVVSSDRGLCGGLNINIFKAVMASMKEWDDQGVEIDVCTIGKKAGSFFARTGGNIVGNMEDYGDSPRAHELIGTVKVMLDAYYEGKIDRLFLVFNDFVNTMTQQAHVEQLLPLQIGRAHV